MAKFLFAYNLFINQIIPMLMLIVAQALIKLVEQNKTRFSIGFAERFFAKLNAILPTIVDNALAKKLPIIKHHTFSKTEQSTRIDNAQNTNELSSKLI